MVTTHLLPDGRPRCVQGLEGGRQCSRAARYYLPSAPHVTTCEQHHRTYDLPLTTGSPIEKVTG